MCQQDAGSDNSVIDTSTCKIVGGRNGVPQTVILPGSDKPFFVRKCFKLKWMSFCDIKHFQLIILAKGFTSDSGLIALDNVRVSSNHCGNDQQQMSSIKLIL